MIGGADQPPTLAGVRYTMKPRKFRKRLGFVESDNLNRLDHEIYLSIDYSIRHETIP